MTFCALCRFGLACRCPSKSTLLRNIKCLPAACLEAIHRLLVKRALAQGVESGSKTRIDCTVTETNVHEPTDSSLLWEDLPCCRGYVGQAGSLCGGTSRTPRGRRSGAGPAARFGGRTVSKVAQQLLVPVVILHFIGHVRP